MKKIVLLIMALGYLASADTLRVACAAGYKKPMMEVIALFEANGTKVEPIFANMQQVIALSKSADVDIVVGDKSYLKEKSDLNISEYAFLGQDKVVVAFSKDINLRSVEQLGDANITKIAIPQPQKTIYGQAGLEFLISTKLYEKVKDKLYKVATVPQVTTYLVTGEIEAGIINLSTALVNKEKLGGYLVADEKSYTPIEIVAGALATSSQNTSLLFIDFLRSKEAKAILAKYGL